MTQDEVWTWVLVGFVLGIAVAVLVGVALWGFTRWREAHEDSRLNDRIAGIAEQKHWYSHRERGVLRVEDRPVDID